MRSLAFVLAVAALAACGGGGTSDDSGDDAPETPAFEIISADITLQPGDERTFCYYFHTPNVEQVAVNRWVSDMTPGSHHMIYYNNLGGTQPADGTVDECEGSGAIPLPVYGTQVPHEETAFPEDDGNGYPLAQVITPNTAAYFEMHYLNTTDGPLTAHVELRAYALDPGETYTRTDLFGTYNNDIAIPPGAVGHVESATCDVVGGRFWAMSTHSHKQSVRTRVADGTTDLVISDDWENPTNRRFDGPSFYTFTDRITWECMYDNTGENAGRTVYAGQSARTDEMCMATGYYFPAVGPRGCIFNAGQCQCLL